MRSALSSLHPLPRSASFAGRVLVLTLCAALVTGCKDGEKIDAALAALEQREAQIKQREDTIQANVLLLAQREKQLADSAAILEQHRKDLEAQRITLNDRVTEISRWQESILLREKRGPAPAITAERAIVIDVNSDEVLLEKNADRRGQVASTQKLVTALVVAQGGDLDKMITIEKSDTQCAPVRFGLKAGDQYSRRQLLTALLVKSSNDIAQALARDNAGSLEEFSKKMNLTASSLGMKNSRFINPHGLPEAAQYSTARDMARVAKAVDAIPDIRRMVKIQRYEFKRADGSVTLLDNTNRVLKSYAPCDGMKTGYTNAAGYCLIASGQIESRRRIVVVLNDTSMGVWRDAQALLEWSLKG